MNRFFVCMLLTVVMPCSCVSQDTDDKTHNNLRPNKQSYLSNLISIENNLSMIIGWVSNVLVESLTIVLHQSMLQSLAKITSRFITIQVRGRGGHLVTLCLDNAVRGLLGGFAASWISLLLLLYQPPFVSWVHLCEWMLICSILKPPVFQARTHTVLYAGMLTVIKKTQSYFHKLGSSFKHSCRKGLASMTGMKVVRADDSSISAAMSSLPVLR